MGERPANSTACRREIIYERKKSPSMRPTSFSFEEIATATLACHGHHADRPADMGIEGRPSARNTLQPMKTWMMLSIFFFFLREWEWGGAEREGDIESEAGSRL